MTELTQMSELARTVDFLRAFRSETQEPDRLYAMLANDALNEIERFRTLSGSTFADIGGGPGYVVEAANQRGATAFNLDLNWGELFLHGRIPKLALVGGGERLPLRSESMDVVHSSNVLEHSRHPRQLFEELVRISKPQAVIYVTFTNWFSPWGGHETSPWHYLGGERAARRYEQRCGHAPKNLYGSSLHPLHIRTVLRWIDQHPGLETLSIGPRYYPPAFRFLVRIPAAREVATWNLRAVLRRVG
ncbi:MAG: Methyltransferase type 11 [Acidimicrobiia bacterium]|nr:Methyltransferase type 11 [Acidimicrobiia bacterium]